MASTLQLEQRIEERKSTPLDVPLKIGPSAEQCYSDIAHGDAVSSCPEGSSRQHSTSPRNSVL